MSSIIDLKNSKNNKPKNDHSISDILSDDLKEENEDFLKNLEAPQEFDKDKEIPNNLSGMAPFTTFTQAPLSWSAPDKHHELISHSWRKAIIVILVGVGVLAFFWQQSLLTAVTFFIFAFITSLHFWREAKEEQYEIHPHGIMTGGRFHHFRDLKSFSIHYHPQGHHELSLCTGRFLNYYLKFPLGSQDPFEIREALAAYLPEEHHEEGLEDWLRRKLGL